MTRIVVRQLIWNEFNLEHIGKHNIKPVEVEEVARNIIAHKRAKQGRYLIIGRSSSRILTVILNRKSLGVYYPVTARDAAKKERKLIYEKEKK